MPDYSDLRAKAEAVKNATNFNDEEKWRYKLSNAATAETILAILTEREADKARIAELEKDVANERDRADKAESRGERLAEKRYRRRAERAEAELAEALAALKKAETTLLLHGFTKAKESAQ